MKESQMTNEDEKVAVENETPEATQETEAPVETPAEEPKACLLYTSDAADE